MTNTTAVDILALPLDRQYKLLTSTVMPRPIALVSTDGPAGRNAAPFSFFNLVSLNPPMLMFSVGVTEFQRRGEEKDTLTNIRATGDFVVQLVDHRTREMMNACVPEYGASVDEIELAGFTTAPSVRVAAPRLAESPVQLECTVVEIVELGRHPYHMVIGEIVYAHFRDGVLDDVMHVDLAALDLIGRMASPAMYTRTADVFEMKAPRRD